MYIFLVFLFWARIFSIKGDNVCQCESSSPINMIKCVNTTLSSRILAPDSDYANQKVVMGVFASQNIYEYTQYSLPVMASYAKHHRYSLYLLSPETGHDHYPEDRRWNKIKIVADALDPDSGGWATSCSYFVIFDADLIVTNFEKLNIEAMGDIYRDADVIMSDDSLDIGNTGFLIIRNTVWSLQFFKMWWEQRDSPFTFCDQHVLNKIYSKLSQQEKEKIAILPFRKLNSRFPVVETYHDDDPVLHLMGETQPYRVSVFRNASMRMCQDIERNGYSKGIYFSHDMLIELAQLTLSEERSKYLRRCHALMDIRENGNVYDYDSIKNAFESLHEATTNLCDDRKSYVGHDQAFCYTLFEDLYTVNEAAYKQIQVESTSSSPPVYDNANPDLRIFFIELMTKSLYDLVYFAKSDEKSKASERFLHALIEMETMLDMTRDENRIYIGHKKAILFGSMGAHFIHSGHHAEAIIESTRAVEVMYNVLELMERTTPDFSGFVLLYISTVTTLAKAHRLCNNLSKALYWIRIARTNTQVFYMTYSGEERVMAENLAGIHLLEAQILEGLEDRDEALKSIDAISTTFHKYGGLDIPESFRDEINVIENRIGMQRLIQGITFEFQD